MRRHKKEIKNNLTLIFLKNEYLKEIERKIKLKMPKLYNIEGKVIGYKGGIPVVSKSGIKISAAKKPGVKYLLIDRGIEKKKTKPLNKKCIIKTLSTGKNTYAIFCEEVKRRKEIELRKKNKFSLSIEDRKILWQEIKDLISHGEIKPTVKDIRQAILAVEIE